MAQVASNPVKGYPLIALFLLLTACGIIAGLLAPVARAVSSGQVGLADMATSAIVGCGTVMLTGGIVGLFHYRRARGFAWGLLTGAVIGLFAGPLVLVPREAFGTIMGLSVGGSLVIILMSAAFRLSSRS